MQVCAKAGVEPSAVDYIEAHGTGTVAGDGQELGALEEWYGRTGGHTAENPLLIGSVKSNMGHCEGCSGLAGAHLLCNPLYLPCMEKLGSFMRSENGEVACLCCIVVLLAIATIVMHRKQSAELLKQLRQACHRLSLLRHITGFLYALVPGNSHTHQRQKQLAWSQTYVHVGNRIDQGAAVI